MCLQTIDKETKQVTEGWKIFIEKNHELTGISQPIIFETNKWIKDICDKKLYTTYISQIYMTGFHFYFNKKDAEKWIRTCRYKIYKILKVKVKDIVVTGIQNEFKVGVAREIFIEE